MFPWRENKVAGFQRLEDICAAHSQLTRLLKEPITPQHARNRTLSGRSEGKLGQITDKKTHFSGADSYSALFTLVWRY